ncbi:MAG: hypothetical protein AB7W16_09195 [Candidatus Obscuribacterales bacterium]
MSNKAVIGTARDHVHAQQIANLIRGLGFSADEVSIVSSYGGGDTDLVHENTTKAPEGTAVGTAAGAVFGGTLGWLVGAGSIVFPGVGALVAAGPIMAALSAAAAGGAVGGLTGGLIGLGIPEIEARVYEKKLIAGHYLIAAHSHDSRMLKDAEKVMREYGAQDVSSVGVVATR